MIRIQRNSSIQAPGIAAATLQTGSTEAGLTAPRATPLICGTSEMAELIRSFDWSTTALGSISNWSEALLAVVNLMLASPIPTALYWGAARLLLYNDGFRPFTGHRHPASLGAPGPVVWKESWHLLSEQCDAAFHIGRTTSQENYLIPLEVNGLLTDFYWSYSFSPVYDHGEVAGVFNLCQDTTRRYIAERNLRESEQRSLRVLESIADAVIVTDATGHITRMNPVAEALTGWPASEALGRPLAECCQMVDEASHQIVEGPTEKVARLDTVVGSADNTVLIRRDGTAVRIDDSAAPIRGDSGARIGIVLVFRNVDEKYRLEQERRKRAEMDHESAAAQEMLVKLLQWQRETTEPTAMMQAACEMVGHHLRVDRTGFFEMVDDLTSRLTVCWTAGELPLLTGDIPISQVGEDHVRNGRLGLVRAVSDYTKETALEDAQFASIGVRAAIGVPIVRRGRWQTGFYVHSATPREWTEAQIAFVREVANQTLEAVELARAQQEVRQSEARLRKILESIGDAVIVTDRGEIITGMNPVAEQLTGWFQNEAQGRPLAEVFRLIGEHPLDTSDASTLRTEPSPHPLLLRRGGTPIVVEHSRSPMRTEDGTITGTVRIFRDITARENMEQRARQAYKMEALGQLTGGIAHDFNNILAIIMGNLELIAEEVEPGTPARERIEQTVASAERAADLTRRLLAYARLQPLAPVVVDVVHLVHAAAEFLRRSLGPAILLQVEAPDDLWTARVDRNQFENAMLNLAVNARDAMPGGGQLQIKCQNCHLTNPEHHAGEEIPPGEYLCIAVTDAGQGMSSEEARRAIEPFFTTKPIGQGTGLGLSMVYGFLKQSGGHMRIESKLGVGTTVMLYLPRAPLVGRRPPAPPARPQSEPLPRGDEVVLIVEDELAIRKTIGYLLNSLGYKVLAAGDGPAAILHLEQSPVIHLLLTDVVLPNGISGPELARKARVLQPLLKVIFASGYTDNVLTREYGLEEEAHLLSKPFHLAELARMIRALLNQPA